MKKALPICIVLALLAWVAVEARTFTALCGSGASCAFVTGDRWGTQSANLVRTNFNDHETRILALEAAGGGGGASTFTYWFPAGVCQNTTPTTAWNLPGTDPAVAACDPFTATQFGTLDYANGATELSAQIHFYLPADFAKGAEGDPVLFTVLVSWFTSATSGNVQWFADIDCAADGESLDQALDDGSAVTDAAQGTTNRANTATITLTESLADCDASELLFLQIYRDPTTGPDTLAATARLVGVQLTLTRD